MDRWSVHAAELIGVLYAINIINKIALQRRRSTSKQAKSATILSDSMSALQAIQNPGNKSGQQIIHAILQAATNTKTHGIAIRLQWVPGHCDEPGNDTADRLAKEAAIPGKTHPFRPLTITREGPHQEGHLRSMGKGMERIQEWQPPSQDRQLTAGQIHETALWKLT